MKLYVTSWFVRPAHNAGSKLHGPRMQAQAFTRRKDAVAEAKRVRRRGSGGQAPVNLAVHTLDLPVSAESLQDTIAGNWYKYQVRRIDY